MSVSCAGLFLIDDAEDLEGTLADGITLRGSRFAIQGRPPALKFAVALSGDAGTNRLQLTIRPADAPPGADEWTQDINVKGLYPVVPVFKVVDVKRNPFASSGLYRITVREAQEDLVWIHIVVNLEP